MNVLISDVQIAPSSMYYDPMEVAISKLRAELADWIDRVRAGEEVVITDRGTPVARLIGVDTAARVEQLTRDGVLSRPRRTERPVARTEDLVPVRAPVSDYVRNEYR